jgi:uncharacterized MAPEG superfamily protein
MTHAPTLAIWCVLVAALLPIVCSAIAKRKGAGKPRREGGFDNNDPRAWLAKQQGLPARANAAQANSFEALPFFVGAVALAMVTQAPQARVDALAAAFIVCRVVYIAIYLADKASLRSAVWSLGLVINIALLFSAAW